VDKRNGRQVELASVRLEFFPCPLQRATPDEVATWGMAWADPVHEAWTPADGPILVHWIECYRLAARSRRRANRRPVVLGSTGQPVEHPSYATMTRADGEWWKCSQVLGLGALHREKLGISIAERQKGMDDLNREFAEESADDDDPR